MIGQIVYVLCALTSMGCTLLLIGRYRKTRVDLLFWSAAAFFCFTITNILLFVDLVVIKDIDLGLWRNGFTFGGVIVLLYGLIRNNT
jgi:hypothetical protein